MHEIEFKREARRKIYRIVGVTKNYDTNLSIDQNDVNQYDAWEFCSDTYDCFRVYYDENAEEERVTVYEKGGVCDSEDEEDVIM